MAFQLLFTWTSVIDSTENECIEPLSGISVSIPLRSPLKKKFVEWNVIVLWETNISPPIPS